MDRNNTTVTFNNAINFIYCFYFAAAAQGRAHTHRCHRCRPYITSSSAFEFGAQISHIRNSKATDSLVNSHK